MGVCMDQEKVHETGGCLMLFRCGELSADHGVQPGTDPQEHRHHTSATGEEQPHHRALHPPQVGCPTCRSDTSTVSICFAARRYIPRFAGAADKRFWLRWCRFGPIPPSGEGNQQQREQSNCKWRQIQDFDWLRSTTSPNW